MTSASFCPAGNAEYTMDQLNAIYANGLSSNTLTPDDTGRIPVASLQSHYTSLVTRNIIKPRPTIQVIDANGDPSTETDLVQQQQNDKELFLKFREEYCFYEQRYKYALKMFLQKATSRNADDNGQAQTFLTATINLNRRLNSLIEIMSYVSSERVTSANQYTDEINRMNAEINRKREQLASIYEKLSGDTSSLTVQKEMVEYTQEKNRSITNQISLWASLNVLALATIFYVYRSA